MIRNERELNEYLFCDYERAIYRATECGAWAKVQPILVKQQWQDWKLDITCSILGPILVRARRKHGRKWYQPEEVPPDVLACLSRHEFRGGRCLITDRDTILFIKENPQKYYDVGAQVRTFKDGLSIGSIVEGTDMTTGVYNLVFPFTEEQLEEALRQVDEDAAHIWNQTHGCPSCWEGDKTINEWEWVSESGDDLGARVVDPKCKACHGQGIVI